MPQTYIGIDIGGTKIAGAVVSSDGDMRASIQRPTEAQRGRDAVIKGSLEVAGELIRQFPGVIGIGIGSGGQIDAARGIVVSATDILPGWAGTDLRGIFNGLFGLPVAVDNDVNALALGEYRFGIARGLPTVLFLALGTGVGGAILLDGKLHHGARGGGGEFGHLLLDISDDARVFCSGGGRGTLEAYCSGAGLVRTWREITAQWEVEVTAREIGLQAQGHPHGAASEAVARTGEYLGYGMVSLANIFDPDLIVIGGGMAQLGDALLSPARKVLQNRASPWPSGCRVVAASLGENASVIGAASLAM